MNKNINEKPTCNIKHKGEVEWSIIGTNQHDSKKIIIMLLIKSCLFSLLRKEGKLILL